MAITPISLEGRLLKDYDLVWCWDRGGLFLSCIKEIQFTAIVKGKKMPPRACWLAVSPNYYGDDDFNRLPHGIATSRAEWIQCVHVTSDDILNSPCAKALIEKTRKTKK